MNRTIIAIALIGLTIPALAASARYYLEIDTVGNAQSSIQNRVIMQA